MPPAHAAFARLAAIAGIAALSMGLKAPVRDGARSWDAGLRLAERSASNNDRAYRSSSRLEFEFAPATDAVDHYRVVARERGGRITRAIRVAADARRAAFDSLPAAIEHARSHIRRAEEARARLAAEAAPGG